MKGLASAKLDRGGSDMEYNRVKISHAVFLPMVT